ncbi:glycosyltransferase family 4 protein [Alteromonas stellipolaris]|uniref:glycosyltransferase family 4 protein n=1 Tax=Alteromonas stellipolaris TaxID=233316 RepID=UPI001E6208AC|nr:glycosyltransferase family 4 protein [Alteromonas stellipolaris]
MNALKKRTLIISHGHPDFNKGGAEVAAYNLYSAMRNRGEDAFFIARTSQPPHGGAAFSSRNGKREILFHTTMDDGFLFSNLKTRHLWQEFRDLLTLIKPDVVHLHHFFLLGIEVLTEVRNTLPEARIVLTLHEYLAICHNKGLMIKTNGKLCYGASARDCYNCFTSVQPGDFFLREKYIKSHFDAVDHFISPSQFLKQRYVEWGIEASRISVIENGLPETASNTGNGGLEDIVKTTKTFAFFGQINPYKGIDILLKAVTLLPKAIRQQVRIEIHGANLEQQESNYQEKVKKLLKQVGKVVIFQGAYEQHEMPALLDAADWAVVPSIWWENSPVVIQEALAAKVPLIVSNIGGMCEKVRDGVDGFHFRHGNPADLATIIERCVMQPTIRAKMSENIKPILKLEECLAMHQKVYACEIA